jgi:hypothetical protein
MMENDDRHSYRSNESVASNNNHGVTNFLRHFAHRTNHKDGLHQQHHQPHQHANMKKSNRILRTLGRNKHHSNTSKSTDGNSILSPISVNEFPRGTGTGTNTNRNKSGLHRNTEESISFDNTVSETTRLGICPTFYDVPETSDEEVYFINNNVVAASGIGNDTPTSTSSSSSSSITNLFSTLPIWEESCTSEELQHQYCRDDNNNSNHYNFSGSPQKSIGSCDSIKSDGSGEDGLDKYISSSPYDIPVNDVRNFNNGNSSTGNCTSSNISSSLISKAKSIVQRARDKDNQRSDSSLISTSSSGSIRSISKSSNKSNSNTDSSPVETVKIFLLLVEPKSKVFELIQLLYPRKNTKVIDLINMIPQNATEHVLATQTYVGITRPKRRAEPIIDLNMLASTNSRDNTTTQPTAMIEAGEIIVVIPALTSPKEIVVLSKQILSSSHIQKLISISKGRSSSSRASKKHEKNGNHNLTSTLPKASSSPNKGSTFHPISSQDKMNNDARSPKIVSFLDENCTEELKRAMEKANVANEEAGCSPCHTPTSFLTECVNTGPDSVMNQKHQATVEFPRDMLDAYLSKDAVLKMCSTPQNHSHHQNTIPNIECTSSSSMVDDNDETTTSIDVDISSCDGSMTSSFQSWTHSLDSRSIPLSSLQTKKVFGNIVDTFENISIPNTNSKKKRLITKKMKRIMLVSLFILSIVRYHFDPNGVKKLQYPKQNVRLTMLFEPMGLNGVIYLFFMFVLLVKLQKYYYYSKNLKASGLSSVQSQCPCLGIMSKISKKINRYCGTSSNTCQINNELQKQPPLVPTSIHAIKFD